MLALTVAFASPSLSTGQNGQRYLYLALSEEWISIGSIEWIISMEIGSTTYKNNQKKKQNLIQIGLVEKIRWCFC